MIDLTPLDVRNKRGDFKKLMRGYDPQEVDVFLELAAERLEGLVRENLQMRDRLRALQEQVDARAGREQAVQDALVTAQELRKDIREQAQREADHLIREAESEARRLIAEAEAEARARVRGVERQVDQAHHALQELERRRVRFLQEFRGLLQRELDVVESEENRAPVEDRTIDLELGSGRGVPRGRGPESAEADRAADVEADRTADVEADRTADVEADRAADVETHRAEDVEADGTPHVDDEGASDRDPPARPEAPDVSEDVETTGAAPRDVATEGAVERFAPEMDGASADGGGAQTGSRPDTRPVDVADLEPEDGAGPSVTSPTAEADREAPDSVTIADYPDVPDLETVLAEAGMDEVRPPPVDEVAPPRATRRAEDSLVLFDQDDDPTD